jgi:MAX-like protein X
MWKISVLHFNLVVSNRSFVFQFLLQQKKKQEEERNALRKEVVALRIMQANYEQIVKAHQNQPGQAEMRVSDETKFQVVSGTCTCLYTRVGQIYNNARAT